MYLKVEVNKDVFLSLEIGAAEVCAVRWTYDSGVLSYCWYLGSQAIGVSFLFMSAFASSDLTEFSQLIQTDYSAQKYLLTNDFDRQSRD